MSFKISRFWNINIAQCALFWWFYDKRAEKTILLWKVCYSWFQFLTDKNKPTEPAKTGAYVDGLWLNHASWDFSTSTLKSVEEGSDELFNVMPVVWLKPLTEKELDRTRSTMEHETYDCPLYFSSGSRTMTRSNVIASVALPTQHKPSLWAERRVHLTCAIQAMDTWHILFIYCMWRRCECVLSIFLKW